MAQQLGPNSYRYSLDLNNTGTTQIGTFWFAWIPNYDFLTTPPTAISSPTGWTGMTELEVYGGVSAACIRAAGHAVIVYGDFAVSPGPERRGR